MASNIDDELEDEIRILLGQYAEECIRRGMTKDDAEHEARRRFDELTIPNGRRRDTDKLR